MVQRRRMGFFGWVLGLSLVLQAAVARPCVADDFDKTRAVSGTPAPSDLRCHAAILGVIGEQLPLFWARLVAVTVGQNVREANPVAVLGKLPASPRSESVAYAVEGGGVAFRKAGSQAVTHLSVPDASVLALDFVVRDEELAVLSSDGKLRVFSLRADVAPKEFRAHLSPTAGQILGWGPVENVSIRIEVTYGGILRVTIRDKLLGALLYEEGFPLYRNAAMPDPLPPRGMLGDIHTYSPEAVRNFKAAIMSISEPSPVFPRSEVEALLRGVAVPEVVPPPSAAKSTAIPARTNQDEPVPALFADGGPEAIALAQKLLAKLGRDEFSRLLEGLDYLGIRGSQIVAVYTWSGADIVRFLELVTWPPSDMMEWLKTPPSAPESRPQR